jgi:hypothetical protein
MLFILILAEDMRDNILLSFVRRLVNLFLIFVAQIAHTFALYEAGYGIMNEHQVGIGESTCAARFWAPPTIAGGKAAIEARQMTQICLERAATARDCIQIMGDLAVQYGFYTADWSGGDMSLGEGGEALTVVDKEESWVFHVLGDDTHTSAVWVAQRVPDNHVRRTSCIGDYMICSLPLEFGGCDDNYFWAGKYLSLSRDSYASRSVAYDRHSSDHTPF